MKILRPGFYAYIRSFGFLHLTLLTISTNLAFSQDQMFPTPAKTGVLGVQDQAALSEVVAFIRSTKASAWRDLYGTGTLSYQDGESHNVSLYLKGTEYSRLDIEMDSGTRSVRLNRSSGAFRDSSGEQSDLLPETARSAIVAFPRIWVEAPNSKFLSLYDHGQFTATGQALHRITIEYQLNQGSHRPGEPTVATDLYFDPSSHALVFSVDSVRFVGSTAQPLVQIVMYGGYQAFNGVIVPTSIQQTLNGQPQWAMQLNQVTINTNLPTSTFSF